VPQESFWENSGIMSKKSDYVISKMNFSIYNHHSSERIFGNFSICLVESTTQPFLFSSAHFLIFPHAHFPPYSASAFYFLLSPLLQYSNIPLLQQSMNGYSFFNSSLASFCIALSESLSAFILRIASSIFFA